MWCIITSVLFQDGDVQFQDEVTHFLDPPRTTLLQTCRISLLRSLPKIVVLVSNDRDFIYHDYGEDYLYRDRTLICFEGTSGSMKSI